MKRILLLPFLVLSATTLWGTAELSRDEVVVEKDGISVRYWICTDCLAKKFGPPYYITITNNSAHPIIVGPSLIDAPLYTNYQEIAKEMKAQIKPFAKWSTGTALALGFMTWYLSRSMGEERTTFTSSGPITTRVTPWEVVMGQAGTASAAILATFFLYLLVQDTEKFIANVMLREPITIQPGKSITKRFWLKNPNDQVEIDFDTVKVLK